MITHATFPIISIPKIDSSEYNFFIKIHATFLFFSISLQQADKNFEIYTYNQSQLFMVDADDQPENSISTSYNYNTRQEEWIDGKSGWERVEFGCKAFGGRPIPTFRWYINNNQNDDLTDDNHFQITTSSIGSQYDFIENYQSTIDFQVDDNFLETLNK